MQVTDQDRATTIHGCTAVGAISMWLAGAYRVGDEPAMLSVIRRETCSDLSDSEIRNVVYAAFDQGCDAAAVLARIVDAERWDVTPRMTPAPR
jgi:hypothetical protein